MVVVDNFSLSFGHSKVLKNISFTLELGRPLALVGESGAGKSSLARSLMGMNGDVEGVLSSGVIDCDGVLVTESKEADLRHYRGNKASLVVQHLADVLNPQISVLEQVIEPALFHEVMTRQQALSSGKVLLEELGIGSACHDCYPKRFSGGEVQRIMLAMALINDPHLLILDEPTASLDPETRQRFLKILMNVSKNRCLLIITHDIDVAKALATETGILYGGALLEIGATEQVLSNARHPYTRGLLRAKPSSEKRKDLQGIPGRHIYVDRGCVFAPRCTQKIARCEEKRPILQDSDQKRSLSLSQLGSSHAESHKIACHRGGVVSVLAIEGFAKQYGSRYLFSDVALRLFEGETVAIIGKSGSGKSTLVKIIMGLECRDAGKLSLEDILEDGREESYLAEKVGFISQHPKASMSPRFTVKNIVQEPLDITGGYSKEKKVSLVKKMLAEVQLPVEDAFLKRRPESLSGGELQRLAIARALIRQPKIIIADEPTSALDVSVQAKIMKLLLNLQENRGMALLIVTHDTTLAEKIADRIYKLEGGGLRVVSSTFSSCEEIKKESLE